MQIKNILSLLIILMLVENNISITTSGFNGNREVQITLKKISDDNITNTLPQIWEKDIIWVDLVDKWNDNTAISYHNLTTNETMRISYEKCRCDNPVISSSWIVYEDRTQYYQYSNFTPINLTSYNLINRSNKNFTNNHSGGPSIWEDEVVYISASFGITTILINNLTINKEIQINVTGKNYSNLDIWKNFVVWDDNRNGKSDIFLYDTDKKAEIQITTENHSQYNPSIWGNIIVWSDNRYKTTEKDDNDIYFYNINTKKVKRITSTSQSWMPPVIWDDNIVYFDIHQNQFFIYNITREKTYIIDIPGLEISSAEISIYQNQIVFPSSSGNQIDIYLLEFKLPDYSPKHPLPVIKQYALPISITSTIILVFIIVVFIKLRRKKTRHNY